MSLRILACAPEFPGEPHDGMTLPMAEVFSRLADRHDITLVTFEPTTGPLPDLPGIEVQWVARPKPPASRASSALTFLRQSARREPFHLATYPGPLGEAFVARAAAEHFDVAHIHSPAYAVLAPKIAPLPSVVFAFDAWHVNAAAQIDLARGPMRIARVIERDRVKRFERKVLPAASSVALVSLEDIAAIDALKSGARTRLITNGVGERFFEALAIDEDPNLIVFVGTMSWEPNVQAVDWFTAEVLPRIRQVVPAAHLAVVGREPDDALRERMAERPGVTIVGEVPDVRDWLQRAAVSVVPMVGGTGIKNKLLEALASGAPVVATSMAMQGTTLEAGRHLLAADSAEAFSASVVRTMTEPDLRTTLITEGRAHMRALHDWDQVADRYEELYTEAVNSRRG